MTAIRVIFFQPSKLTERNEMRMKKPMFVEENDQDINHTHCLSTWIPSLLSTIVILNLFWEGSFVVLPSKQYCSAVFCFVFSITVL